MRYTSLSVLAVMILMPAAASAQVPCLRDPVSGRPVVPQGHANCSLREPPASSAIAEERASNAAESAAIKRRNAIADLYNKGIRQKDLKKALEYWERASTAVNALDPSDPRDRALQQKVRGTVLRAYAVVAANGNDYESAERWLRQALDAEPSAREQTEGLLRWVDEERARSVRIAKLDMELARLKLLKNVATLFENKDFDGTIRAARSMLALHPDYDEPRWHLVDSLLATKRWREAETETLAFLEREPRNPGLVNRLGVSALNLDKYDAAEAHFSEATLLEPGEKTWRDNLAVARRRDAVARHEARENAVRAEQEGRAAWRAEVRRRLENIDSRRTPPITPADFRAGDILLFTPGDAAGHLTAVADQLYRGRVLTGQFSSGLSHAVTVVGQDARGKKLFLDTEPGIGPHVIGELEFEQKYGRRGTFVARPQMPVEGLELLRFALEKARKQQQEARPGTDYGFLGDDAVCSELAAFAVVRATLPEAERLAVAINGGASSLFPVDVTPGDFRDEAGMAKFFILMKMDK